MKFLWTAFFIFSATALAAQSAPQPLIRVPPPPEKHHSAAIETTPVRSVEAADEQSSPLAPDLAAPATTVVRQAGVGGSTGYARAGVLEMGGSLSFMAATGQTQLDVRPSVGWFMYDNWEISGLLGWTHVQNDTASAGFFTLLGEPSLHIPFAENTYAFVGAGLGIASSTAFGTGIALAPRVGINILVGRSGVLTPEMHFVYSTNRAIPTAQGTVLAVNSTFGFGAGYTVMW